MHARSSRMLRLRSARSVAATRIAFRSRSGSCSRVPAGIRRTAAGATTSPCRPPSRRVTPATRKARRVTPRRAVSPVRHPLNQTPSPATSHSPPRGGPQQTNEKALLNGAPFLRHFADPLDLKPRVRADDLLLVAIDIRHQLFVQLLPRIAR